MKAGRLRRPRERCKSGVAQQPARKTRTVHADLKSARVIVNHILHGGEILRDLTFDIAHFADFHRQAFDKVLSKLRQVLRWQPDSSIALVEMAKLVLAQGRARDAIAYARRAVDADPKDADAVNVLARARQAGQAP